MLMNQLDCLNSLVANSTNMNSKIDTWQSASISFYSRIVSAVETGFRNMGSAGGSNVTSGQIMSSTKNIEGHTLKMTNQLTNISKLLESINNTLKTQNRGGGRNRNGNNTQAPVTVIDYTDYFEDVLDVLNKIEVNTSTTNTILTGIAATLGTRGGGRGGSGSGGSGGSGSGGSGGSGSGGTGGRNTPGVIRQLGNLIVEGLGKIITTQTNRLMDVWKEMDVQSTNLGTKLGLNAYTDAYRYMSDVVNQGKALAQRLTMPGLGGPKYVLSSSEMQAALTKALSTGIIGQQQIQSMAFGAAQLEKLGVDLSSLKEWKTYSNLYADGAETMNYAGTLAYRYAQNLNVTSGELLNAISKQSNSIKAQVSNGRSLSATLNQVMKTAAAFNEAEVNKDSITSSLESALSGGIEQRMQKLISAKFAGVSDLNAFMDASNRGDTDTTTRMIFEAMPNSAFYKIFNNSSSTLGQYAAGGLWNEYALQPFGMSYLDGLHNTAGNTRSKYYGALGTAGSIDSTLNAGNYQASLDEAFQNEYYLNRLQNDQNALSYLPYNQLQGALQAFHENGWGANEINLLWEWLRKIFGVLVSGIAVNGLSNLFGGKGAGAGGGLFRGAGGAFQWGKFFKTALPIAGATWMVADGIAGMNKAKDWVGGDDFTAKAASGFAAAVGGTGENTFTRALANGAKGALIGSVAGPVGAAIGGAIGTALGVVGGENIANALVPSSQKLHYATLDNYTVDLNNLQVDNSFAETLFDKVDLATWTNNIKSGVATSDQLLAEVANHAQTTGISLNEFSQILGAGVLTKEQALAFKNTYKNNIKMNKEIVDAMRLSGKEIDETTKIHVASTGEIILENDKYMGSLDTLTSSSDQAREKLDLMKDAAQHAAQELNGIEGQNNPGSVKVEENEYGQVRTDKGTQSEADAIMADTSKSSEQKMRDLLISAGLYDAVTGNDSFYNNSTSAYSDFKSEIEAGDQSPEYYLNRAKEVAGEINQSYDDFQKHVHTTPGGVKIYDSDVAGSPFAPKDTVASNYHTAQQLIGDKATTQQFIAKGDEQKLLDEIYATQVATIRDYVNAEKFTAKHDELWDKIIKKAEQQFKGGINSQSDVKKFRDFWEDIEDSAYWRHKSDHKNNGSKIDFSKLKWGDHVLSDAAGTLKDILDPYSYGGGVDWKAITGSTIGGFDSIPSYGHDYNSNTASQARSIISAITGEKFSILKTENNTDPAGPYYAIIKTVDAEKIKADPNWKGELSKNGMTQKYSFLAAGLDAVPYDDFPAFLHKGEMVVPAEQANYLRQMLGKATVEETKIKGARNAFNSLVHSIPNPSAQGVGAIDPYTKFGLNQSYSQENISLGFSKIGSHLSENAQAGVTLDSIVSMLSDWDTLISPPVEESGGDLTGTNPTGTYAAVTDQAAKIINKAKSLLGSTQYNGLCQKFVRTAYNAAGIDAGACCATDAYNKWAVSSDKTNIPPAAAVYFEGSGSVDSYCGRKAGHVGLSIGNDMMIHGVSTVKEAKISTYPGWRGWGWQAGTKPTGITLISTSTEVPKQVLQLAGNPTKDQFPSMNTTQFNNMLSILPTVLSSSNLSKMLPSLTLGQAMGESSMGTAGHAVNGALYNWYGHTGTGDAGYWKSKNGTKWAVYSSPAAGAQKHINWFEGSYYKDYKDRIYKNKNYASAVQAIHESPYCGDGSNYYNLITSCIKTHNLNAWDHLVKFAQGGKLYEPTAAIMGEDAPRYPEYIIPTNPQYRERAQTLVKEASGELGMTSSERVKVIVDQTEVVSNLEEIKGYVRRILSAVGEETTPVQGEQTEKSVVGMSIKNFI